MKYSPLQAALISLFCLLPTGLSALAEETQSILDLDIESLMDIQVTTVSKREQSLFDTAAAVFVLTNEDIRRSGANSVPEALRLVPGVSVARINAHQYAISARGLGDQFADKLLVLMDGRSVYTPLFGGVYWDVQDTPLHDVERIEVIRGPGASIWGANAVNGVINIITKKAQDTKGWLVSGGGGSEEQAFGVVRYGAALSDSVDGRTYFKFNQRDGLELVTGGDSTDSYEALQGGFRLDMAGDAGTKGTVQGDIYSIHEDSVTSLPSVNNPFSLPRGARSLVRGGNILGRWEYGAPGSDGGKVQFYYSRDDRKFQGLNEVRDTVDLDLQHAVKASDRLQLMTGVGYRVTHDDILNIDTIQFSPNSRTDHLLNGFIQGDYALVPKQVTLTMGAKVEHNDYTGVEIQPSVRAQWSPSEKHSLWVAASRATKTPSRAQDDIRLVVAAIPSASDPLTLVELSGDRDVRAEQVISKEIGYRYQPTSRLLFDLAGFWNSYKEMITVEPGAPRLEFDPIPHLVVPSSFVNMGELEIFGGEFVADYKPFQNWKLQSSYSYLRILSELRPGSFDQSLYSAESKSPRHQAVIRSQLAITESVEFDTTVRYVSAAPAGGGEEYTELDVRLGWKPYDSVDISIIGHNLLADCHKEFKGSFISYPTEEVQRSVWGRVTFTF